MVQGEVWTGEPRNVEHRRHQPAGVRARECMVVGEFPADHILPLMPRVYRLFPAFRIHRESLQERRRISHRDDFATRPETDSFPLCSVGTAVHSHAEVIERLGEQPRQHRIRARNIHTYDPGSCPRHSLRLVLQDVRGRGRIGLPFHKRRIQKSGGNVEVINRITTWLPNMYIRYNSTRLNSCLGRVFPTEH